MISHGVPEDATVALLNETMGVGGVEVLLIQMAEELRSRGREVVCILPSREGWLPTNLQDRGFPVREVKLTHFLDLRVQRHLARELREAKAHVIHSHEFAMSFCGAAAGKMLGLPHVTTMHGNQDMTDRLRRRIALRWAFKRSRAVVAVSEATRQDLVRTLGLPESSIHRIRNGIPVRQGDAAPVREELGLGPDTLFLLGVGNLRERKGYHVLIEALYRLEGEPGIPDWKLLIAGEGDQRARLEGMTEEFGLQGKVLLPGRRDDIPNLQAAADLFIMPSLWEGLPLAVLEAMFAETALVGTMSHGIPEAVDDEREGLLVPPGDVAALAGALRRMFTEPSLRRSLSAQALRRARGEFTVQRMMDEYERLYWSPL